LSIKVNLYGLDKKDCGRHYDLDKKDLVYAYKKYKWPKSS